MMTSSNGNFFRVTGPLCEEFTGHRRIPLTQASDAELSCFLWSVPWINGWVNNREAGDKRRHCAHYDVIVVVNLFSGECHRTKEKSTSVWVLAVRCHQTASHYLNQCWPRSMSPYGGTIPQRVKFQHRPWVCPYIVRNHKNLAIKQLICH